MLVMDVPHDDEGDKSEISYSEQERILPMCEGSPSYKCFEVYLKLTFPKA